MYLELSFYMHLNGESNILIHVRNMISCIEMTKQLDVLCTVYMYIHVYIMNHDSGS